MCLRQIRINFTVKLYRVGDERYYFLKYSEHERTGLAKETV